VIEISSSFDGGNIEVVDATDPTNLRLRIVKDDKADFFQWFYFRVSGVRRVPVTLVIENAGASSYPKGWENYNAVASSDCMEWERVDTVYDGTSLTISDISESDVRWYAYFAPYSLEQHQRLIGRASATSRANVRRLGSTLDGRDLDLVRFGRGEKQLWIIARQHPGESMAGWFMEGVFDVLLDSENPITRGLARRATMNLVPNMNPDGVYRGYLRTNAAGANLNREWQAPSLERSPEVFHVEQAMREIGLDMCLDAHGDEGLPYNFIAGYEGVPEVTEAHLAPLDKYRDLLASLTPDFQTEHGYPKAPAGKGNLTTSTGHIANTFRAPAMTLEMPFKDTANNPMPAVGWSPERCKLLAGHCLQAMLMMMDDWKSGL